LVKDKEKKTGGGWKSIMEGGTRKYEFSGSGAKRIRLAPVLQNGQDEKNPEFLRGREAGKNATGAKNKDGRPHAREVPSPFTSSGNAGGKLKKKFRGCQTEKRGVGQRRELTGFRQNSPGRFARGGGGCISTVMPK